MALPNPALGDTILASHITDIKSTLEGGTAMTAAYHLKQSSGDMQLTLADSIGTNKLRINNSAGTQVASIDSLGNATFVGLTLASFVLPLSAAPALTAAGAIQYDTVRLVPTVGTGAATKTVGLTRGAGSSATATAEMVYDTTAAALKVWDGTTSQVIGKGMKLVGSSTTPVSTTSTTAVDLVTVSSLNIPVSSWILVRFTFRKQALAAQAVAFGLKINSTIVTEASNNAYKPRTSATNQVESGYGYWLIPPRETANYGFGVAEHGYKSYTTAGVVQAGTITDIIAAAGDAITNAVLPQATVTSIAIRAINATTSNVAEIASFDIYELVGS